MLLYAAREKCNRRKCNENVENALKCTKMLKNAYGKKPHHFREKTPLIPAGEEKRNWTRRSTGRRPWYGSTLSIATLYL